MRTKPKEFETYEDFSSPNRIAGGRAPGKQKQNPLEPIGYGGGFRVRGVEPGIEITAKATPN